MINSLPMKIYTVIPFFSIENEVNTNDVKSFTIYDEAYYYANAITDGKRYEIVKSEIVKPHIKSDI
tara:strand:+ start:395 stop:592 length:198 start_codon:yes stop_codon:yes gene_type:complete